MLFEFSLPTVTYGIEVLLSRSFQAESDLMLTVVDRLLSHFVSRSSCDSDCLFDATARPRKPSPRIQFSLGHTTPFTILNGAEESCFEVSGILAFHAGLAQSPPVCDIDRQGQAYAASEVS